MNASEKKNGLVKQLNDVLCKWHEDNPELAVTDIEMLTHEDIRRRKFYLGLRVTVEVNDNV